MAVIPVVVCGTRRRWRPLIIAACAALPVFVAFAAMGFSWTSGFAATRRVYWSGVAIHRPYVYFLFADLALLAVAVGPAIAVGVANLRDRDTWLLVGAIGAVVVMADVSGMSKGEVERIWLPFVPWAMLAVVGLSTEARSTRGTQLWLLLQVASTLVVATTIWSQW
jgi:methylthioxylose transferase